MGKQVHSVHLAIFDGIGKRPKRVEYPCTHVGKHMAVLRQVTWTGQEKRKWQVSHRPTGYQCASFLPTKSAAIAFAEGFEARAKRLGMNLATRSPRAFQNEPKYESLKKYVRTRTREVLTSPV